MGEVFKYNFWASTDELMLGDVVDVGNPTQKKEPFKTAIVKQVDDEFVTFYRPYGVTASFTFTGGVICYTGSEEWKIARKPATYMTYMVFTRDLRLNDPKEPVTAEEIVALKSLVAQAKDFYGLEIGGDDQDGDLKLAASVFQKLEDL